MIRGRWPHSASHYCACVMLRAPHSSSCIMCEKSIGRHEIGSAFRGPSALHAVGDSYLLLTRPSPQFHTIELRFQFRYAAPQPPRLLQLDSQTLWFSPASSPESPAPARRKVERNDITAAMNALGTEVHYNQLRQQIITIAECSK